MTTSIDDLRQLVEREIAQIDDPTSRAHARSALTEPQLIDCGWDYGEPDQTMPCWVVAQDQGSGIAYCDQGFGPRSPWGLIWLPQSGKGPPPRMGQDCSWFPTLGEAFEDWLVPPGE